MSTTFRLPRPAAVDIAFEGELLADATSDEGQDRWQEIRVYSTTTDRWVVERVGRSRRRGEVDKPEAFVCDSPDTVRAALQSKEPGRTYLTNLAYDALTDAADKDPRLAPALVETV